MSECNVTFEKYCMFLLNTYLANKCARIFKKLILKRSTDTVQFNYNFTHAWHSTHGDPQVFACKIQKFTV